jgi:cytochrome c-type biogenesis protein CcmE
MNKKFVAAVCVVVVTVVLLMIAAVTDTAKAVTTVESLVASAEANRNLRLGARVADKPISNITDPTFQVHFFVHGKDAPEHDLPIVYHGVMPETLRAGRDVILEGDFDGERFVARSLLTQCPSKYEPPIPGEGSYD